MNTIGFKGFTKPTKLTGEHVKDKMSRLSIDGLYVYWSGGAYRMRRGSGRSGVLTLVTEKRKPVSLKTLCERAAKASGDLGYSPDFVRSGLFLHGGSKPSVYFAVTKDEKGNLIAARDYDYPDEEVSKKPIKQGDIIVKAKAKEKKHDEVTDQTAEQKALPAS